MGIPFPAGLSRLESLAQTSPKMGMVPQRSLQRPRLSRRAESAPFTWAWCKRFLVGGALYLLRLGTVLLFVVPGHARYHLAKRDLAGVA